MGYTTGIVVTPAVQDLRRRHPDADVRTLHLAWNEPRPALLDYRVDAAVARLPFPTDRLHVTVKLPEAGEFALTFPFAQASGYGLGKSGWVTSTFGPGDSPPVDILKDWIEESYRAVAPKRLVRELKG